MTATNEDILTHKREQREGLRPPPKSRITGPTTKRAATNRKAKLKHFHGHHLPDYEAYLVERLRLVRELMKEMTDDEGDIAL
jgi:hypothetical protein